MIKSAIMKNDRLIGCSQAVADSLSRGGLKNDITYIDNAVDFTRLGNASFSPRGNTILLFGYDFHTKGVDIALKASEKLSSQLPNLRLNICVAVGMESIRQKTKELLGEIPSWVSFLPPTADIGAYYRENAVYLCASRKEGFCYALVESAYCGCLPVSSRIDGPSQIAINGIRWFPSENIDTLASVLKDVLTQPEEARLAQAQEVHEDALNNYQLHRWAVQVLDYLKSNNFIPE